MRHIAHRSSQVRELVFVRDPIYRKEVMTTKDINKDGTRTDALAGPAVSFGYETSENTTVTASTDRAYHVDSPEIVIPGLTMLQSPILSRSGTLERGGFRVTGGCTFYAPSLDYIKALDNFKNAVAFAELESYDKLIDIERILLTPADIDITVDGNIQTVATFSDATSGYEIDRLQFKAEIQNSSDSNYENLSSIRIGGNISGSDAYLQWAPLPIAQGGNDNDGVKVRTTAGNNEYNLNAMVVDLPIKGVEAGDTTTIWENGTGFIYSASITNNFDIDKLIGDSNNELGYIKIALGTPFDDDCKISNIKLYKQAEWRIEAIKDYRDEYMQISAARVRGSRASRRRAYG
jgi:hypothetical protein